MPRSCGFSGGNDQQNTAYPFLDSLESCGGRTPLRMPMLSSSIVDTGGPLCLPSVEDQRGRTRPMDGNPDAENGCELGAVKFDPLTDPIGNDVIFADGFD